MTESAAHPWSVVVPVKGTAAAKSRLGESAELAMAIALDSVEAAIRAVPVIVVTTAEVAPQFEALGARVLIDAGGGLNAACRQGIDAAGAGPVAVMLGDVPALEPGELVSALAQAERHPLAFVADADEVGTVLIAALDARSHRPAFGADSRAAHLAAGYLELDFPRGSGLRRDVDTVEQLAGIARERLGARTLEVLEAASPPD